MPVLGVLIAILLLAGLGSSVNGQHDIRGKAGLIQFSGVVMSSDSLRALPYAHIVNLESYMGTISNHQGFFSLVAAPGDTVLFTCIGFKDAEYVIPEMLEDDRYSIIQLMTQDTVHLDVTIIYPWPSKDEFREAFLALDVPDTYMDRARANLERELLREIGLAMAPDGNESADYFFRQEAKKYYYAGQPQPIKLFDVFAWKEFIDAWRRGDFKRR